MVTALGLMFTCRSTSRPNDNVDGERNHAALAYANPTLRCIPKYTEIQLEFNSLKLKHVRGQE